MRTGPHEVTGVKTAAFGKRQADRWSILLPMLVAAVLRAHTLVSRDLWHDEALQFMIASAGTTWDVVAVSAQSDLHPPLYSLGLACLTSFPPWVLRVPSLVAGIVSVALAYRLGMNMRSTSLGARLAWLVAVSPPWVAYGHEARAYAVSAMLVLGLYAEITQSRPRTWRLCLWGVSCGLVQYGAALVALPTLFVWVGRRWRAHWAPLGWTLAGAGCSLFFLFSEQWERGRSVVAGLPGRDGLASLLGVVDLLGWLLTGAPALVTHVFGVVGAVLILRGARLLAPARWRNAAFASVVMGVAAATVGWYPLGGIRQSLVLSVPLLVLSTGLLHRVSRAAFAGLVCLLLAAVWVRSPGVPVEEMRVLLASIEDSEEPRWVHASAAPAYAVYSSIEAERVLGWSERPLDLAGPVWLIGAGRFCGSDAIYGASIELVERKDARGACALRLASRGP